MLEVNKKIESIWILKKENPDMSFSLLWTQTAAYSIKIQKTLL